MLTRLQCAGYSVLTLRLHDVGLTGLGLGQRVCHVGFGLFGFRIKNSKKCDMEHGALAPFGLP